MKRYHNLLKDIYQHILENFEPKLTKITIYGEYFGGLWPANHPQSLADGAKPVQKGVYYTPNH